MNINQFKLKNGATCIVIPAQDSPSVTVMAMARIGSKYENDSERGLSHFLEHMLFKGTEKYPTSAIITEKLEGVGAHYNAFTSHEFTGYYAKVARTNVELAMDIIGSMYTKPLFDSAELEKEKGVIVEEIRMYRDMPDRHVWNVYLGALHGDTPAGRSIAGTIESVRSFTQKDFQNYFKRGYGGESTIVVVSGGVDSEQARNLVEKYFSDVPQAPAPVKVGVVEKPVAPTVVADVRETDQTHIIVGVRAFGAQDPRRFTLRVLTAALGGGMSSRLFKKLRDEMGVGYYVRAEYDSYTDHGSLAISAGVDNSRIEEVIPVILNECADFTRTLMSEAELNKVKEYIIGSSMLSLESSDAQADYCANALILRGEIESIDSIAQKIRSVSAADVQALAKELFVTHNLVMASVGRVTEERAKPLLKFV
jgi:predicted Zn-dependent peptidase